MLYLASPYSHPDALIRVERFNAVCRVAVKLVREGQMVYSPIAHTHPLTLHGLPGEWNNWMEFDRLMITKAATSFAVLMLQGWRESVGIRAELLIAKEAALPIRYLDAGGERVTTPMVKAEFA